MTEEKESKPLWNSLEIAKLLVSGALPLILLYLGNSFQSQQTNLAAEQAKSIQQSQRKQIIIERVVQWRFDKYEQAAGLLNDMYAYYIYVGKWKEFTPQAIVQRKREVDKIFYSSGPIFSDELIKRYDTLIEEMFAHYQGWGEDAALRTSIEHRKEGALAAGLKWDSSWDKKFTNEDNRKNIKVAYQNLTKQLGVDLNLTDTK